MDQRPRILSVFTLTGPASVLFFIACLFAALPARSGEVRRDLTKLDPIYRDSVLRGWRYFQTSYAEDGVACAHCHRDHRDLVSWALAYPKVQVFDQSPYGVKTLRMVILEALTRHTDLDRTRSRAMADDLAAYIAWWGDGQPVDPGITEDVPSPVEDRAELEAAVQRGRTLFHRDKPLSCSYCHVTRCGPDRAKDHRSALDRSFTKFPRSRPDKDRAVTLHTFLVTHRRQMGVVMGSDDIPDIAAYLAELSRGTAFRPGVSRSEAGAER